MVSISMRKMERAAFNLPYDKCQASLEEAKQS